MGNQPSRDKKGDSSRLATSDASGPGLESYPSFSRSDTKESSRSLRGSIRSKIPGSAKSDASKSSAPTAVSSASEANGLTEKSDAASVKSSTSNVSAKAHRGSNSLREVPALDTQNHRSTSMPENLQPPPSPTKSSSLGQGHKGVDKAQRTGEVGNVSDAPPQGKVNITNLQTPKEPILMKKDEPIPRTKDKPAILDGNGASSMDIGGLKNVDLDDMITRLLDAGYAAKITKAVCLKNAEITAICQAARELFLTQPALLELSPPVKIVGDVHGQYGDLIRLFEMSGFPPNANYLFLGDYVDRGKQSLETILLLLCYKLKFPENFFLLRGNHECANVTRVYGFYDECKRRCNVKIWKAFIDTFNTLPIAAIVAGKIFCVHGGLSPSLAHMDDIRQIARPTDVPDYGLLNDLLWSDPAEMESDWESNERGVSYCFGKKVILEFLQRHDFDLVCRAHMVVEDGYEFFSDRILVTVFSAPNVSNVLLFSYILCVNIQVVLRRV